MTATMIKLERSAKMEAAIVRCRQVRPRVRRVDAQTVNVTSANGSYTVRTIEPRAGLKLAECNCQAGKKGLICYHLVAAMSAPVPAAAPAPSPRPAPRPAPAIERETAILVKREGKALRIDGWLV